MKTGYEIAYIAWGVGLAAGFGMVIGVRGQHELSGMVASAIAVGGICAAKFMIYSAFTSPTKVEEELRPMMVAASTAQRMCVEQDLAPSSPECGKIQMQEHERLQAMSKSAVDTAHAEVERWKTDRWSDAKYTRAYLVHAYAEEPYDTEVEELPEADTDEDEEYFSKPLWEKHKTAAVAKVDAMTPDQIAAEARRISDEHEQQRQAALAIIGQFAGKEAGGFFKTMFGFMDILFVLLAIASAYKLASPGDGPE
jgi:hypothetical protein